MLRTGSGNGKAGSRCRGRVRRGAQEPVPRRQPVALATVVATWHSAPQPPGAAMAVATDGTAIGSVSGGCVEGGGLRTGAAGLVDTGQPELERYGISDDDAYAVGLTCGGILDVFVEPVDASALPGAGRGRRRRRRPAGAIVRRAADVDDDPRRRQSPGAGPRPGPAARPSAGAGRPAVRRLRCGDEPARRRRPRRRPRAARRRTHGDAARTGTDGQRRGGGVSLFVDRRSPRRPA